ncbi:MAG: PDZ domain-containing protein [Gammaproteobacteria bacterium]
MIRTLGLIVVALGSGMFVGRFALDDGPPGGSPPNVPASPFVSDSGSGGHEDVAATIDSLIARIEADAAERKRLERRLETLEGEVRMLRGETPVEYTAFEDDGASEPIAMQGIFPGDTLGALVAAGVEESQAREIKRQMDALDLEMMNLQYAADQGGEIDNERFAEAWRENQAKRVAVRETIGDDAYDRFLYAMGQANRIAIQDVLEGSPAQDAGLKTGDLLLSYDGERLFTVDDLMRYSRSGEAGRTVTLEVVRDGRHLQLYMPRGPLGIRSGFHRADPDDASS